MGSKLEAACAQTATTSPGCSCTCSRADETLQLVVSGKAASSSEPAAGHNALVALGRTLRGIKLAPSGPAALLAAVQQFMSEESSGRKLGLYYGDNVMGELLVVPTGLHCLGDEARLDVSMYRPRGVKAARFESLLHEAETLLRQTVDSRIRSGAKPLLSEPWQSQASEGLLDALLQSYLRGVGRLRVQALPPPRLQSVPHSTFARLFADGLSFGPSLPGTRWLARSPDEHIPIWQLGLLSSVYLDAIIHLQGG
ncbi:MAG: hypothetical protein EOO40_01300 [Deltaproteobacteria bacterium]|nr:MAG: hypothetical protein EOO40_01300 [Deltaproteobacteria bacterium]